MLLKNNSISFWVKENVLDFDQEVINRYGFNPKSFLIRKQDSIFPGLTKIVLEQNEFTQPSKVEIVITREFAIEEYDDYSCKCVLKSTKVILSSQERA